MRALPSIRKRISRGVFTITLINIVVILLLIVMSRPVIIQSLSSSYLDSLGVYLEKDMQYVLLVNDPVTTENYIDTAIELPWIVGASITDSNNILIASSGTSSQNIADANRAVPAAEIDKDFHSKSRALVFSGDEAGADINVVLNLTMDSTVLKKAVTNILYALLGALLIASIFIWAYSLHFSRRSTESIIQLNDELQSIDADKVVNVALTEAKDTREIDYIIKSMNDLLEKVASHQSELEDTVKTRTVELNNALEAVSNSARIRNNLVMNLSHDLRSPLTSNLGYINYLIEEIEATQGEIDKTELSTMLEKARHHALVLSSEIDTLMQYSISDYEKTVIANDEIEIENLIDSRIADTEHLRKNANNQLIYNHTGESVVRSSRRLIQHIVDNLLSNAHRYCTNGNVLVESKTVNGSLEISVSDNGIGIPESEIDQLFELSDSDRAGDSVGAKGMGIGLSLTKLWIDMLEGEIKVSSTKNQTKFTVHLPSID